MDHLQSIGVFCEVARLGSFSQAARAMGLSPPSVSRLVGDLEQDLGVRLFNRTTRSIALTDAGEEFLHRSEYVLEEFRALREETRALHREPRGQLRVSAVIGFGSEKVAPALARFQDQYPAITVNLHLSNRKADLVSERIDIAVRIGGKGGLDDSSLIARKISEQRLLFTATPGYLKRHGTPQTLDCLDAHRIIKQISGSWGVENDLETQEGLVRVVLADDFVVNNPIAARTAVLQGHGIGLVADYLVESDLRDGRLVRILPHHITPPQGIFAIYPHRRYVAAKTRLLVEHLIETL